MMKLKVFSTLMATGIVLVLSNSAGADTVVTSSSVDVFFDNSYSSFDVPGDGAFLIDNDISGLDAFDQSLGNLDRIEVGVAGEFTSMADVYGYGINPFSPLSGEVSGLLNFGVTLVVWNSTNGHGSGFPLGPAFREDTATCDAFGDGECSGGTIDNFRFGETFDISSAVNTNFNDFIGSGSLDPGRLTLGIEFPETLEFLIDGVDEAYADVFIESINSVDITVTYDYTPTAVPLPAGIWLMISASGLLMGVARRRNS